MHSSTLLLAFSLLLPATMLAQSAPEAQPALPPEPAADEASQELAVKQQELGEISQQIGQIQTRAEAADEVKASKENYRDTLQAEMVRAAPDLEADIDRQARLVDELTDPKAAEAADQKVLEQQQEKLNEYRALHEKLAPVEEGVRDVPAVQSSRKEYFDKLIAEMQRIEPRTQDLLAKHRELMSVVRELSTQARSG